MEGPTIEIVGAPGGGSPRMRVHRKRDINSLYDLFLEINWQEPLFLCLIGFHATCFFLTFLMRSRKYYKIQIILFLFYLGVTYSAQYLNELAAANWDKLASEQYFDSRGMFISATLSGPLLINSLVIVLIWLYESFKLMLKVRDAKIEQIKRAQSKENEKKKEM